MNDKSDRRRSHTKALSYTDYLRLDRLLDCQHRESERAGAPAHDEMLFIVVHQAYELWFRQILFELGEVQRLLAQPRVAERDVGRMVHLLSRVAEILKLLVRQLDVLETMTPLDFLEFRELLTPASGFQSAQFREIEARLGLTRERRLPSYADAVAAQLGAAERERLARAEAEPTIAKLVEAWLERTPFLDVAGFHFHQVYRNAVSDLLRRDLERSQASATAEARDALRQALERFAAVTDEARYAEAAARGLWTFSLRSLRAALFIVLYRDEPILHLPFRLLDRLMEIDETLTSWRYRHALMVERMIGLKLGTGGSAGYDYLRQTVAAHRVFPDLFALSTFLIPRSALPPLPEEMRRQMDFAYAPPRA